MTPNKRQRARAMLLVALDRLRFGDPIFVRDGVSAESPGSCQACTLPIELSHHIVRARFQASQAPETWMHAWCLNRETWLEWIDRHLEELREPSDPNFIVAESVEGRERANCGHNVEGEPVYLIRVRWSLNKYNHSRWICKDCKRKKIWSEVLA